MQADRRIFVIRSAAGVTALASSPAVFAMAGPVTDENDPKAVALGYKNDASKIDIAKFPKYAAGQICAGCVNFQGKAGIPAGPCTQLPKPVLGGGWCSAYAKKS